MLHVAKRFLNSTRDGKNVRYSDHFVIAARSVNMSSLTIFALMTVCAWSMQTVQFIQPDDPASIVQGRTQYFQKTIPSLASQLSPTTDFNDFIQECLGVQEGLAPLIDFITCLFAFNYARDPPSSEGPSEKFWANLKQTVAKSLPDSTICQPDADGSQFIPYGFMHEFRTITEFMQTPMIIVESNLPPRTSRYCNCMDLDFNCIFDSPEDIAPIQMNPLVLSHN